MHGLTDEELDLTSNLEVEAHLQECPSCGRAYANHLALKSALGNDALYYKAPANLRNRVRAALREADEDERKPIVLPWRWLAFGASFALVAVVVWSLAVVRSSPSADDLLAHEVVSAHVRSLMADHLTDVPSSDQHTVKPWFNGKLDFSPTVTDLASQGFPLIGGRLDYIGNRPIAALVYQRRQHLINVFVYPSVNGSDGGNRMAIRQGYNLIHWNRSGMDYWAVSDLNASELQEFANALQTQP